MTSDDRSHDAALRKISRARDQRVRLEREEVTAVAAARQLAVTWWDIGIAIGMQQPAATRKFLPLIAPLIAEATPQVDGLTRDQAVGELQRIRKARLRADDAEVEAVRHARDVGVAWQKVGDVLGMARSNTVVKFKPLLEAGPDEPDGERLRRSRRSRSLRGGS